MRSARIEALVKQPLAHSALSFHWRQAGICLVVLKALIQPGPKLPGSPSSLDMEASLTRPILFRCVKVKPVFRMRPQKATIGSQPASGSFEKATKPFGTSENLMPMGGDKESPSFEDSRTK